MRKPGDASGRPSLGDADLILKVRAGDGDAYGLLYERHVDAARAMARQIVRSPSDVDDVVSDAFVRVLNAIRNGNGPTEAFRPYLLTAVRHRGYDHTGQGAREQLVDEPAEHRSFADLVEDLEDGTVDRELATTAFLQLPERWQAVLWHTEVEEAPAAEVGELLGINANATAVLAHRAREGLRQAYLQAHLAEVQPRGCDETLQRLGAFVRGGLAKRAITKVEQHLHDCGRCRNLRDELSDLNTTLRRTVAPAILGPAAVGYLLTRRGGEAASAAVAAGAGGHTARNLLAGVGAVAVLALVGVGAVHLQDADGDGPTGEVAAAEPTGAPGGGDDPVGAPVEAPLPDEQPVIPISAAAACGAPLDLGGGVVLPGDGPGDVTGAALLWNDGEHEAPGLDLPATGQLLDQTVDGALDGVFAFVTDVTGVVEEGGACGLGALLNQLPQQGVGQWALVLSADAVIDVVDATIDLLSSTTEVVDATLDELVGLSVADAAEGGVLEPMLQAVERTVGAALAGASTDGAASDPIAGGEGGRGTGGGSPSSPGSGASGGGSGGTGGGGPVPTVPPATTPTTSGGGIDDVVDPVCDLLDQLLGLC
jgi:RNA polymerase sigma factor (sigma-70 family)